MSDRNPTSIRLSTEQEQALDAIGEREDRSRSWLIRRAVDEFIERHGESREEAPDIERH